MNAKATRSRPTTARRALISRRTRILRIAGTKVAKIIARPGINMIALLVAIPASPTQMKRKSLLPVPHRHFSGKRIKPHWAKLERVIVKFL